MGKPIVGDDDGDNRAAVHRAVQDYGDFPRVLERVLIDDEPLWRNL